MGQQNTPNFAARNSGRESQQRSQDALDIKGLDRAHHFHPFTDPQALVQAPPFVMEKGEGCYVMGQGMRLLDAMAGLGSVNIGYGRTEMAETAMKAMENLSFYHSFAAITNPAAAELAAKIAELAPKHMNKVFFANSGSEANETALKLVNMYWRRRGLPNKRLIISRDFAYHGSTMAVSALNGLDAMHKPFGVPVDGAVVHVQAPFWYRFGGTSTPEDFGLAAARTIESAILEAGAANVAAFVAEPIQGTLGAIIPPMTYWPEVERICKKHNVLLVADEVVTGMGRTGAFFAQETFGFEADIMTLAKGLSSSYQPISAVVMSDKIAATLEGKSAVLQHGFTTSGHPVTAAVALKNIEIIEREGLVSRIANDIGPYFASKLATLERLDLVGEVRCSGLMAGIELAKNKETRTQYPIEFGLCQHVAQACLARGLIVRPAGNILIMCPPFIITHTEIDYLIEILDDALQAVTELLRKAEA